MKDRIKESLWNAACQIWQGKYHIFANEYAVGREMPFVVERNGKIYNLVGTIDRIDMFDNYVRVIDYKSGDMKLSDEKLEAGIQLQLPLYSLSLMGDLQVSGMYYFRIKDVIKDVDMVSTDNSVLKEYKLSGPTLDNIDVIEANDCKIRTNNRSDIISAEFTTKGEVSKKSNVLSSEKMIGLMEQASEKAAVTIDRILKGETKAAPVSIGDFDSCRYCKYRCLCNAGHSVTQY